MGFGERLRAARESRGLTQQQVADQMGIDKSTYCGYETGKRQPDMGKLKMLSRILEISGDILLETEFAHTENAPAEAGERAVSDEDIKFALFGGSGEITDAMYEEVRRFAAFVKQREAEKKE